MEHLGHPLPDSVQQCNQSEQQWKSSCQVPPHRTRWEWYPVITLTYHNVQWWRKAGTTLQKHPLRSVALTFSSQLWTLRRNPTSGLVHLKTQTIFYCWHWVAKCWGCNHLYYGKLRWTVVQNSSDDSQTSICPRPAKLGLKTSNKSVMFHSVSVLFFLLWLLFLQGTGTAWRSTRVWSQETHMMALFIEPC